MKPFPALYPDTEELSSCNIFKHLLSEVEEFKVVCKNKVDTHKDVKVFYKADGKDVMLVNKGKTISNCKSYRKKYQNFTQIADASHENEALNGAVIFAQTLPSMKGAQLEKTVEWAKDCKITNYRFYSDTETHIIKVVIQYVHTTDQYHVVSDKSEPKNEKCPIDMPTSIDVIKENDGEEEEIIKFDGKHSNSDNILEKADELLIELQESLSNKDKNYEFVDNLLQQEPKSISLLGNCKFKEITVKYKVNGNFIFIYFLQEKKTQTLKYLGYTTTDSSKDPSFKGETSYNPEEFSQIFGYKPAFSRTSVKKVTLRESNLFKKKTIKVNNKQGKIDNYVMYFTKAASGWEKLNSCACRADKIKKTCEKWSNILGFEKIKSTDIETIKKRDAIAVSVLEFVNTKNNNMTKEKYHPIAIEVMEYELTIEYVILYANKLDHAIAVVVHDK